MKENYEQLVLPGLEDWKPQEFLDAAKQKDSKDKQPYESVDQFEDTFEWSGNGWAYKAPCEWPDPEPRIKTLVREFDEKCKNALIAVNENPDDFKTAAMVGDVVVCLSGIREILVEAFL